MPLAPELKQKLIETIEAGTYEGRQTRGRLVGGFEGPPEKACFCILGLICVVAFGEENTIKMYRSHQLTTSGAQYDLDIDPTAGKKLLCANDVEKLSFRKMLPLIQEVL